MALPSKHRHKRSFAILSKLTTCQRLQLLLFPSIRLGFQKILKLPCNRHTFKYYVISRYCWNTEDLKQIEREGQYGDAIKLKKATKNISWLNFKSIERMNFLILSNLGFLAKMIEFEGLRSYHMLAIEQNAGYHKHFYHDHFPI